VTVKPSIVCVSPMPEAVADRARRDFEPLLSQDRSLTLEETLAAAFDIDAEALLVSTRIKLNADAIAALPPNVKIIATYSVGYDHIEVDAAQARGVLVTNTPEVLTDATADLTFMLLLCACRRAREYVAVMESGWRVKFGLHEMLGTQVSGKTLGILGMGRIGRAVARRAQGFDMKVVYNDKKRLPVDQEHGAYFYSDFREMLPNCDILSLHAPAEPSGRATMDREAFGLMRKGAVFINAARGQLVDEDALIETLQSGHLAAAGLDVFRSEPNYDLRLRSLTNLFLTPHMGSATVETRNAMGFRALDNISAVLSGKPPIDPVWRGGQGDQSR
jgi:lactate dehydrogenase-like 2-hydroxyacid dehydrogenase